jgi:ribosomal 30S subunit maturation factor RimM
MTGSMNDESDQKAQKARMPQSVVEDIDQYLEDGMPVVDLNNNKVGNVKMYSTAAGYLMVGTGAFEQEDRYIPFRLIRSIDPHNIFVAATKETLDADYTQPPQTRTEVETRLVAGPGGSLSPQTREVQVLQSGYNNAPVELNAVDLGGVADRLAVGMVVYDASGKRLGDITQYDTSRSLMVVEKGLVRPRALFVPFNAIKDIDIDTFTVDLSVSEDTLLQEHSILSTKG